MSKGIGLRRGSSCALFLLLAWAVPAGAQATRTWVSGVGDDANPCSRTAPCKTFAGAISKTAAAGEINIIDPGGFGAVTITKSISIEADGSTAGVLASGTNGIVVNAGPNDVVVLRGLVIEGIGTGLNGINFLAGGTLIVEDCTINNFSQRGINFAPSGPSQLIVRRTRISNNLNSFNGGGILIKPGAGGSASALIEQVRLDRNLFGVRADDNSRVNIRGTVAMLSTNNGFLAFAASLPSTMDIVDSAAIQSTSANVINAGVKSSGANALVRLNNVAITGNAANGILGENGGQVLSFGNNKNAGNSPNNAPTGPVIAQQ